MLLHHIEVNNNQEFEVDNNQEFEIEGVLEARQR